MNSVCIFKIIKTPFPFLRGGWYRSRKIHTQLVNYNIIIKTYLFFIAAIQSKLDPPFKHSISGFNNCACNAVCNTNIIDQYQLIKGESLNTKKKKQKFDEQESVILAKLKKQRKQRESNLHAETLAVFSEGRNTESHGGDRTWVDGTNVVHYINHQVFLKVLLAYTHHYQALCVVLQIKCMKLTTNPTISMNSTFSFIISLYDRTYKKMTSGKKKKQVTMSKMEKLMCVPKRVSHLKCRTLAPTQTRRIHWGPPSWFHTVPQVAVISISRQHNIIWYTIFHNNQVQ